MDGRDIVLDVIAEVSGVERAELTPETDLVSQLRIDSPKALQLLLELEDRLGIEIDDDRVADIQTVGHILDVFDPTVA